VIREGRGKTAFWLMVSGMLGIILSFTIAGVLNVYLARMVGLPFMTVRDQYIRFWMAGVFTFGLVLFLPGITLYVIDFFGLKPGGVGAAQKVTAAGSE